MVGEHLGLFLYRLFPVLGRDLGKGEEEHMWISQESMHECPLVFAASIHLYWTTNCPS